MRSFGWFISESSEHNAEYTPYFLKRDDQIAEYDVPVDEYIRRSERNLRRYQDTREATAERARVPARAQRRVRIA